MRYHTRDSKDTTLENVEIEIDGIIGNLEYLTDHLNCLFQSPPRPASLSMLTEVVQPKADVDVAHSRQVKWPQRQLSKIPT